MDEDGRRDVGLFRYALIRDAADPALSKAERGRLVRALAEREHVGLDGRLVWVARGTVDQWIRAYRAGGFDALLPKPRVVAPLTPAGVLELAFCLKRERPDRTAAQIRQVMLAADGDTPVPGLRTLQTHLARQGLNVRADGRAAGKVYGRFEASVRNELWTGDGLHGPKLSGAGARRAVLLAFIDDHSRLLVGWRWGTGEDVFGLEAALRSGLMTRGVPDAILVDRGSAFVSSQLLRACAVLGVRLIHASPRAATTSCAKYSSVSEATSASSITSGVVRGCCSCSSKNRSGVRGDSWSGGGGGGLGGTRLPCETGADLVLLGEYRARHLTAIPPARVVPAPQVDYVGVVMVAIVHRFPKAPLMR